MSPTFVIITLLAPVNAIRKIIKNLFLTLLNSGSEKAIEIQGRALLEPKQIWVPKLDKNN